MITKVLGSSSLFWEWQRYLRRWKCLLFGGHIGSKHAAKLKSRGRNFCWEPPQAAAGIEARSRNLHRRFLRCTSPFTSFSTTITNIATTTTATTTTNHHHDYYHHRDRHHDRLTIAHFLAKTTSTIINTTISPLSAQMGFGCQ